MLLAWGELLAGVLLLYFGAEWLVRGAAGIALAAGLRPLIIGLTVVAYGTSMPELTVGISSALGGNPALALGNSLGSNIANIGLILAMTVLISPPRVDPGLLRREVPMLVGSSSAVPLVVMDGTISRLEGASMLTAAVAYTLWMMRSTPLDALQADTAEIASDAEHTGAPAARGWLALSLLSAAGLALLFGGGHIFVRGAVTLAAAAGISERVVGLTVVAIGTSLPELAASLVASLRGHGSIAVGNVIGSNIFNILLILGVASVVRPIETRPGEIAPDIGFLLVMTLIAAFSFRSARRVGRLEGAVMLLVYVAFLVTLVLAR